MKKRFLNSQPNNLKSSRLRIILKLKNKDGRTSIYHSSKTKRIHAIIKKKKFFEAFIKVDYGYGFNNSGVYANKKQLLFALKAFSEKSLVDYLRS